MPDGARSDKTGGLGGGAWAGGASPGDAAAYSDRTGVIVGSGGGNFQNQYDFFPLMTEARGDLGAFGR
ncbi:MAG TPA: hypothetical protein PK280_04925, partial [Planctomycetota bacterium]|nr:hypothetical protein [Planctomycetota bacterium]